MGSRLDDGRGGNFWALSCHREARDTRRRCHCRAKPGAFAGAEDPCVKHGRGLRALKDMTDVAQLLSVNRIDPKSGWVRELFEKHGDMELYERVIRLLS